MSTIAAQMLTIAVAILQRQEIHNLAASRNDWLTKYDYIVVGAGSAGSIVASRLSENHHTTVLLLEAGGASNVITDIPGANGVNDAIWNYRTEPNDKIGQINPRGRLNMLRGKLIGGTAMLNGMIINRGSKYDFDNWESTYGAENWNYRTLLPYFRKYETFYNQTNQQFADSISFRGNKGPIRVSLPQNADPLVERFIKAFNHIGYKTGDINGPEQALITGLYSQSIDPETWTRSTSAREYLYPHLNRTNLHILARAQVTKLLLNSEKSVSGVEFYRNEKKYRVIASREVILSAGAINTPQILMLSGIGPKNELSQHNIKLVTDLPVGKGLQDHPQVILSFLAKDTSLIESSKDKEHIFSSVPNLYDYFIHKTGPLTQFPFAGAFYSTPDNSNSEWPNINYMLSISQVNPGILASLSKSVNPTEWTKYYSPLLDDNRYFEVRVGLYRCYSRGKVTLVSSNPFDAPLIDPNYYSDPRDLKAQLDGVKRMYEIAASSKFSDYAMLYDRPVPGCEEEYDSCLGKHIKDCSSYLRCYSRYRSDTAYHLTSTASMGDHEYAVVDHKLRVKNIQNLRVIDASVIPETPNGNTNAAIMAVAERGAKMILDDYDQE